MLSLAMFLRGCGHCGPFSKRKSAVILNISEKIKNQATASARKSSPNSFIFLKSSAA
jgi:hypothetical protein